MIDLNEDLLIQMLVIGLLIGIGLISFSTVGFSLRACLEKQVWGGIPKVILIIGVILTIFSGIILLFI